MRAYVIVQERVDDQPMFDAYRKGVAATHRRRGGVVPGPARTSPKLPSPAKA
jgi:hypothetical protein